MRRSGRSRVTRRARGSGQRAGWSYLGVSVNNALYTLNAFRPSNRSRLLFGWSFFASWITIELAPYILLIEVLVGGWFVRKGALRTTQGKVGMVLTLGTFAGMVTTIRRSYAARHEIRQALRDVAEINPPDPLPVRWERRIEFARAGGRALRMDVLRPDVADMPDVRRPVLVQVHGGGWVIGFKDRQGQLLMREMARRGWVCCNVDYRLSPTATFPDHLVDVKRSIAWIREHATELGVDPGFVAITGGSAGGHLAALTALTANQHRYQPGFADADTSVVAAVPFYGVYDFTDRNGVWPEDTQSMFLAPVVMKCDPGERPDLWADASPIDQVHPAAPAFLVIHGDRDVLAPVEDARSFVAALRDVSEQPVYYLELAGAQHAFETFASVRANAVVAAVGRFLEAVHDAYVTGPGMVAEPGEVSEAVVERLGPTFVAEYAEPGS